MGTTIRDNLRVMILASGDLWAGAEAVVYELCRGLVHDTPAEVTAVFLNEGELSAKCRQAAIPTHIIDEKRHGFLSLVRLISGLASQTRPQIIHAHRYKENMLALLVKPFLGQSHLVSTVHGRFDHNGGLKLKALNLANALILGHAFSAVVAVSKDLQGHLRDDVHIPESRIRCIANGMGSFLPEHYEIMSGDFMTVGSAGRLFPVKDYPLMVDVAKEVCSRIDNARFFLAGDGPGMQLLQDMIRNYGLGDRFILLGHVQDMEGFYRSIDVYLNTSRHEGMPMTLLEAMSHGIPVVAPSVGGLKEMITHGVEGVLVEERTAGSFADALIGLMRDRHAARSMGMQARQRIEQDFSSRKMVKSYYDLYSSLF